MSIIGVHQPYLFPYKGYFDLIRAVDKFVIYDDAKYMKGKYVNRNYFPMLFTFQLKKHSDYATPNEIYFCDIEADKERFKKTTGLKADRYLNLLKQEDTLTENIVRTLRAICDDLGITTPFYFASQIPHGKFVNGVLDMTKALGGDTYMNLPGGKSLYDQSQFGDVKLEFIETTPEPSVLCSPELKAIYEKG